MYDAGISGDDDQRIAVSLTKARLSQLGIVLQLQYDTVFKRLKRERVNSRLGKGMKAGKDGQAVLTLGKDSAA